EPTGGRGDVAVLFSEGAPERVGLGPGWSRRSLVGRRRRGVGSARVGGALEALPRGGREVLRLDARPPVARGLDGRRAHLGEEISDVAGPVAQQARLHQRGVEREVGPYRADRALDVPRDLLGPVTQRRERDHGSTEAEVEVLADAALGDLRAKVA